MSWHSHDCLKKKIALVELRKLKNFFTLKNAKYTFFFEKKKQHDRRCRIRIAKLLLVISAFIQHSLANNELQNDIDDTSPCKFFMKLFYW